MVCGKLLYCAPNIEQKLVARLLWFRIFFLEVSNYFKIDDKERRKFDNIDKKCMENAYVKFLTL